MEHICIYESLQREGPCVGDLQYSNWFDDPKHPAEDWYKCFGIWPAEL